MNKVFLIGNLTRDPELTTTTNGVSLCKFSLAVSRKFVNSDGEKDVDFINIIAWRQLGELCSKYLVKGRKACIVGSLQVRSYEASDGTKRTAVDVVADDVEFLGGGQGGTFEKDAEKTESSKPKSKGKETVNSLQPVEDDDLPF